MFRIILPSLLFTSLFSFQLDKSVNGTYHLGVAERGTTKVLIEYGEFQGKIVVAVQQNKGAAPFLYYYQEKESAELNTPIFMNSGLYLIPFDNETFALIQPNALLGKNPWRTFMHVNIYSKNQSKAKSFNRTNIEAFAMNLSNKIMNQEIGTMAHSTGTYYLAVPQKHSGNSQNTYEISFKTDGMKSITVSPCNSCNEIVYDHLPEESAIAGVDIYRHSTSYYLFDLKDGVLIYTFQNASGLGKQLWGKNSQYNVYSNNQNYIRQIVSSKSKQDIIDTMMDEYFRNIKTEFERRAEEIQKQRVAAQELPNEGFKNGEQKKLALAAAKRWANAWSWKETLENAYFTSSDWAITRNRLTEVITGKIITGVVTMKHPDGRCRFQYVSFRMDFDGSNYVNLHMSGVGPIYDLQCGKL